MSLMMFISAISGGSSTPTPAQPPISFTLNNANVRGSGNSLMYGHLTSNGGPMGVLDGLAPWATNGATIVNVGKNGYTLPLLLTRDRVDVKPYFNPAVNNFLVFIEGPNTLMTLTGTAADWYAKYVEYYNEYTAQGWFVFICTIPAFLDTPGTDTWSNGVTYAATEVKRQALNTLLTGDTDIPLAQVVKLHERSEFQDYNDTTYYNADKLHLTNAGNIAFADEINTTIAAFDPVADVDAPEIISAYISTVHTAKVVFDQLTYDADNLVFKLAATEITPTSFTTTGDVWTFTFAETFDNNSVLTVENSGGDVVDRYGNVMASISPLTVVNILPDPATYVDFDYFSTGEIFAYNNGISSTAPSSPPVMAGSSRPVVVGDTLQFTNQGGSPQVKFVGFSKSPTPTGTLGVNGPFTGFYFNAFLLRPINSGSEGLIGQTFNEIVENRSYRFYITNVVGMYGTRIDAAYSDDGYNWSAYEPLDYVDMSVPLYTMVRAANATTTPEIFIF